MTIKRRILLMAYKIVLLYIYKYRIIMDYTKLVITLLVLLLVSFIYKKINDSNQKSQEITDYDLVRSYLLDETTLE